jgi:hypothetical protein
MAASGAVRDRLRGEIVRRQITPSGPRCLVAGASRKSHRRTWAAKKRANPQGRTIVDIYAKKAEAAVRISLARRSSRFSRSPTLRRCVWRALQKGGGEQDLLVGIAPARDQQYQQVVLAQQWLAMRFGSAWGVREPALLWDTQAQCQSKTLTCGARRGIYNLSRKVCHLRAE